MKISKIVIFIYLVSLALRLWNFNQMPIYSDEITWMVRGKELIYAISHGNINFLRNAWWTDTSETKAIGLPLSIISGSSQILLAGQSKYSLNLLPDVAASRLPVIFLTSFIAVLVYKFALLINKNFAFLAAVLYASNPAIIGVERWAINDGLLTVFSMTSIYLFVVLAKNKGLNIIPSFFLALAFLTKPTGLLVGIPWIMYTYLNRSKKLYKYFLINVLSTIIIIQTFWPHSWFHFWMAIPEYVYRQLTFAQSGVIENYYFGVNSTNPHWSYYIFQIFSRLTEITVVGILFGLLKLNKKYLYLGIYILVYAVLVSVSSQKIDLRYVLPILPMTIIISAGGLYYIGYKLLKHYQVWAKIFLITGILLPLMWINNTHIYFNKFVGGPKGAQKFVLVGWCTSSKDSLKYLNEIGGKESVYIAGCPAPSVYYSPRPITTNYKTARYLIIETYFNYQHPEHQVLDYIQDKEMIYESVERGVVLARIYKNF